MLEKPGYQTSIHITIYLPTAGKESEFVKELSILQNTIDKLCDEHPDSLVFIRGDANASLCPRVGNKRDGLFQYFMEENKLDNAPINHKTYHHFTNNGMSDSCIDVIIFSTISSDGIPSSVTESVCKVICGKTNPAIDSSHDALLTTFSLPPRAFPEPTTDNIEAPRLQLTRHKIIWSESGISDYQKLLSHALPQLNSDYSGTSVPEVASVLFQVTNHILNEAAKATNKHVEVGKIPKPRRAFIPPEIKSVLKVKRRALINLNNIAANPTSCESEKEEALKLFKKSKIIPPEPD